MTWEANSFLCVGPDAVLTPRFGDRRLQLGLHHLSPGHYVARRRRWPQAWDSHLDLLRTSYPDWVFDNGYLSA